MIPAGDYEGMPCVVKMLYKPNSERTKGPWIRRLFRYREWLIGEGYFGGSLASSVPRYISSVIISGGSSGWDSIGA